MVYCRSSRRLGWATTCEDRNRVLAMKQKEKTTSTTGALSELKAAVDLMERRWQVFRAISPDASCDLIIMSGDELKRVQVRTAKVSATGKVYRHKVPEDAGRQDLYAYVT